MIPSTQPHTPRERLVEAYLGYRVNNHELVQLAQLGVATEVAPQGEVATETAPQAFDDKFTEYTDRKVDWRGEVTPEQVDHALEQLGLKEQFTQLDEGKVWSAEDRAVYRRLSQPDFDPSLSAADSPAGLDPRLLATVESSFSEWDRNGDIRLERQELDFILSGGAYGEKAEQANAPETAAALATLLRYHDLLGSGQPSDGSGISLADLNSWNSSALLIASGAMTALNETYVMNLERAEGNVKPRPLIQESIDPSEIRQGVVGSCVLLSTAASLNSNNLYSLFSDSGDQSYQVQFADGSSETVLEPSNAERLHHTQGANGDRWPAILEIAAAQRLFSEGKRSEHGLRGIIEGIDPAFAISALTGKPAEQRSIDELSLAQTRELLTQVSDGPLICGSRPNPSSDFINVEELHNGIANGHCYAIKGYNAKNDTVSLQNPWHKGEWKFGDDGGNDGRFDMPMADFYSSFRWVAFPQRD